MEWNAFHHHRATSQYPVDYRLSHNSDGSKTIWVGEVENRHGMSWEVGLTLFPDKSYIQVTGRFFNTTADRNSMLHWNNVATHANENYQIIFPENTEFGMFHHKSSFIHWPVPQEPYKGHPYRRGRPLRGADDIGLLRQPAGLLLDQSRGDQGVYRMVVWNT